MFCSLQPSGASSAARLLRAAGTVSTEQYLRSSTATPAGLSLDPWGKGMKLVIPLLAFASGSISNFGGLADGTLEGCQRPKPRTPGRSISWKNFTWLCGSRNSSGGTQRNGGSIGSQEVLRPC